MKQKTIVQYLILFGLAGFLIWFVLKDIDTIALWQKIKSANVYYMFLIALVGIISIISRAIRWQILINAVEKKPKLSNTVLSIFIGYGVNFVTPRLGEVARCAILAKYEKVSADKLAGTMIGERIFDLVCLIIIAVLTFALSFADLSGYLVDLNTTLKEMLGQNYLYIIYALIALIVVGFYVLNKILSKKENELSKLWANIIAGVLSVFKLKRSGVFIFHTIVIWACYLSMTYLGFKALNGTEALGIKASLNVLTLGSLGFITSPGGTGGYQFIVSNVLISIHNIDKITANAYSWLSWALQNGILLIGAVVALLLFPLINNSKKAAD
jgi:glycosyltransferase 2 family protein